VPPSPRLSTLPPDALDAEGIEAALGVKAGRFFLQLHPSCTSTNSVLLEAAQQGAPRGSVVVCGEQTQGRGRRGRSWISEPGTGLTFSLLWRFPPGAPAPLGLSLAAGVAVARALESLGVTGVGLKWPNDVLLHGGKLSGILVELVPGRRAIEAAVIGIGINLRLPEGFAAGSDFAAADLASCMAQPPTRSVLLARLLDQLDEVLTRFEATGFAAAREEWIERNVHQGVRVRLIAERETIEGRCCGVDGDGALLLATDTGLRRIISGEVSLR
jgi:BirA family transcriptional regulator, biotin operon repressor / biotin---[acetyl-CoA-carboxylase] ligase